MVTEIIIIANIDYATNRFSSLVEASLFMSLQCYQHYLSKASCAYSADLDGCHLFCMRSLQLANSTACIYHLFSVTCLVTCEKYTCKGSNEKRMDFGLYL